MSDQSSDSDEFIPCKTVWLRSADEYLAYMIPVCEAWLPGETLTIPSNFEDKSILEGLIADVCSHLESCRSLRAHIASILQREGSHMSDDEWRDVKTRCLTGEMDMVSLDERCEMSGVPFTDVGLA